MIKTIFIVFSVFILAGNTFAEIKTITLSNALELALQNNLAIVKAEKDLETAQAMYGESFADFAMPSINGSAKFTELDPLTVQEGVINFADVFPSTLSSNPAFSSLLGGLQVISNVYPDNYTAGISVTKTLFAGFRFWNSLSIRKEYFDLARAKLNDMKKETISSVTISFYNLFLIRENIESQLDYNQSLKDHVNFASNNYASGNAMQYDFIASDLRYKLSLPVLRELSNNYLNEKLVFCQQMGLNDPSSVELIGDLLDATNIKLPVTNNDEILIQALSNDINLKSIETSIHVAKLSKDIALGEMYPTVDAFFNYNYGLGSTNSFAPVQRTWNSTWNAGVELSMSFDSLIPYASKTWNKVAGDQSTFESLEAQRDMITNSISLEVQSLIQQLEEGRDDIRISRDDVNLAKLGYRLANERYKAGNSTELEVIDAENSEVEAESRWSKSIFDYYSSIIKLMRIISG
jgi:outer membrane protein TolC